MSDATVLSFEDAMRARAQGRPAPLTDAFLKGRQPTVRLRDCHAAFDRVSYAFQNKSRNVSIFHDLCVAFPKGRKIVVLGHKGTGKSVLIDLLIGQVAPTAGKVLVRSRLSFPLIGSAYFDFRLSVRQNVKFLTGILHLNPRQFLSAVQGFCQLPAKQLDEPVANIPVAKMRRISLLLFLSADVDCRIFDGPFTPFQYGLDQEGAAAVRQRMFEGDYIAALTEDWAIPDNCNLAYLLHEGRLYMFEDVAKAVEVYKALPAPVAFASHRSRSDSEEREDDATLEVF